MLQDASLRSALFTASPFGGTNPNLECGVKEVAKRGVAAGRTAEGLDESKHLADERALSRRGAAADELLLQSGEEPLDAKSIDAATHTQMSPSTWDRRVTYWRTSLASMSVRVFGR